MSTALAPEQDPRADVANSELPPQLTRNELHSVAIDPPEDADDDTVPAAETLAAPPHVLVQWYYK